MRSNRRLTDFVCWLSEQLSRAGRLKEFPEFAFIENDNCSSHPEQLQRAIAVFDRLPSEEKAMILRGWSMPSASMFNREELEAWQEADSIAPFLCIVAGEGAFEASHEVDFERQRALPVRVMIRAGAGVLETLATLRRVADILEANWTGLIKGHFEWGEMFIMNEKSGTSQNAQPLQPASNGGEDAKEATAA